MAEEKALQDYHQGTCFGCGAANEHGLRIKSYREGDVTVCDWSPEPYHNAGVGVMYGGVIASILDCHLAAAAMYTVLEEKGMTPDDGYPPFNCLTANLNIDYLAPTPMDTVRLEARVTKRDGKKTFVEGTLTADGKVTARGKGLFITVYRDQNSA